ncbi:hypothetical protein [Nocardioides lijunqiniae]|uniref:hypothetical protein n=1 Tax=Nocardioides lijunqiniae TaxID=2760832 RepID=UPI0018787738|nr:hypothetical protein [Nocardioides lijunqiniae]
MAVLGHVEFWPPSGWEDLPWTEDPATDALVKSARRVSEAYGDALRAERLEGPCSSLRFFSHPHEDDELQLQVGTAAPGEWESGIVLVPRVVAALSSKDRGLLVLDLIHQAMVDLAPHRGWSLEAVQRARARVLTQGLEFGWFSPWKASPDRSKSARVVFRVADDGFGRAVIEVRDRASEDLVARSEPVVAYASLVSFRASAKTLRWVDGNVQFIPRPGLPYGQDHVSVDPALRRIYRGTADRQAVAHPTRVPVPAIVRVPYGSHRVDETPGVDLLLGFGPGLVVESLPDVEGEHIGDMVEREVFDRLESGEAGIKDWLEGTPIEIVLEYHRPDQVHDFGAFGTRVRRTAKRVSVGILRDASWFEGKDVATSLARDEVEAVAEQVMAALGARAARRQGKRLGKARTAADRD